jgi:hypothetical protein
MGRSVYKQPGTRVDRGRAKEGFQVSKRGWEQERVLQAEGELSRGLVKGLSRGLCHVLSYNVNLVYILLLCVCRLIKELCLGYK